MMKNIPLAIILFVFYCSRSDAQELSRDSALTEIETAYTTGQYLSAELDARRMLEVPELSDSVKVQLEKWIAFSLIAQGKSTAAKERFVALLQIDDTFELDPVFTSPKILSVFNDARTKFITWRKAAAAETLRSATLKQEHDDRTITYRTIVFPGWEQIHHDRSQTGYVLMGAGVISLSSGILFEVLRSDARNDYLKATTLSEISTTYDSYNTYRKAEIYSFSLFALIYVISEIDVFTHADISVSSVSGHIGNQSLMVKISF